MTMKSNIKNTEGSNIKEMSLCLSPRRILWAVEWMNTGVVACAARSRGEVSPWRPVPRCLTAAYGPSRLPPLYALLPASHLAPCSSVQPPWRSSSEGRHCNIPLGGRLHLSLPAVFWLPAGRPPSPIASGLGFQEWDRPEAATGHTGGSCCCSCSCSCWSFASSTETWGRV